MKKTKKENRTRFHTRFMQMCSWIILIGSLILPGCSTVEIKQNHVAELPRGKEVSDCINQSAEELRGDLAIILGEIHVLLTWPDFMNKALHRLISGGRVGAGSKVGAESPREVPDKT